MKRTLTKGERLVAEMCGDLPVDGYPVLTETHPFLRKVIAFTESQTEWIGTVTDLLAAVGDGYTPPNTAARLLRKYDYDLLYKRCGMDVTFTHTNRKRLVALRKL